MNERFNQVRKFINRETALRAVGVFSLASVAWSVAHPTFTAHLSEVTTGIQAYFTRKDPPPSYIEGRGISDQTLETTYNKYFQGKEEIVSKKAWMRNYNEGSPTEGIGRSLSKLANLYYDSQKNPNESFDKFYDRFINNLKQASTLAKLDFHEFLVSLQISGENEAFDGQKQDIDISRVQNTVVPAARLANKEYDFVDSLRPYGLLLQTSQRFNGGSYSKGTNRAIYDLIRVRSEQTTGMMDYEGSQRAEALLLYGSPEAKLAMVSKYPEVVKAYQKTLAHLGIRFTPIIDAQQYDFAVFHDSSLEHRLILQRLSKEYIEKYSRRLDVLAEDPSALAKIGIDENNLDNWQKFNRTDIWYELVRNQNIPGENHEDEKKAVAAFKQTLQADFKNFRGFYYRNLMSQQILNPKFLIFLEDQSFSKSQDDEKRLISKIKDTAAKYQLKAAQVRQSYYEIAKEEGKYEYDMEFQTLVSAILTKKISEFAGPFNPNDKYSFYWHLYRMTAVREMSPNYILVRDGHFAPDASIDPPYEPFETLKRIDEIVKFFMDKGMMVDHPSKHIVKFLQTVYAIKEGNFAMWPNLTDEEKGQAFGYVRILIGDEPQIPIARAQSLVVNLIN